MDTSTVSSRATGRDQDRQSSAQWLEAAVDAVLAWAERRRQRRHLAALDERMLHDIGVSAADVEHEVTKPFWR